MNKPHSQLPGDKILCPSCASQGSTVEMIEQDAIDQLFLGPKPSDTPANLRSYRCPACETVQVFEVD
ncbi:MAG: hypothetical protein KGL63_02925 [Betaproteobacteria bacterium]|uniref:hypothetical protein n=1 Tax=Metallibacterium scheffleri TaxID=993689 RepID=UPI002383D591|nr:hypothetical protein [Metallibacterium scheffleri]MDE2342338.1 hypothetical protein [Betaproteobacteria bacterium]